MGLIHPDNREYATTGATGNHHHLGGGVNPATHIPATQTSATGPAPNTAGPHRHDIANKLDPTVDSDLSKTAAAHNQHTHKHNVNPAIAGGAAGLAGAGLAHHHNHNTPHVAHPGATTAAGTHHNGGLGTAGAGVGGAGLGHSAAAGGRNNGGVVGGSNVQATAGPHSSDMMNRLDPTVDSRTGLRKQI
ncbi:hypothetical protein Sste5346_006488 [Sporothrix stenoceras]|uniref:Period circadian protein n=1 Tax=Sporothrix stenoceras TaxID=5173 RepID=A0ABR3YY81_9PEZI